jgi:hypothetical protein
LAEKISEMRKSTQTAVKSEEPNIKPESKEKEEPEPEKEFDPEYEKDLQILLGEKKKLEQLRLKKDVNKNLDKEFIV